MKTRLFKDDVVTEMGLGCWQLGADWGEVCDQAAFEILQTAYDQGVRFLDTAAGYGGGRSERAIGSFLKTVSDKVFVGTKIGRANTPVEFTPELLRARTENSLKNLQMDCVDLTQLHCVPMECLKDANVWDGLRHLKEDGLVRHFGASVESIEEAMVCMEQDGLSSLQIIFNIFRQHPRDELFSAAKEKGVALIVRVPLASGLLTGKFTQDTTFGEKDHRTYNKDGGAFHVGETFAGIPFAKGVELAEDVKKILPTDVPMAQSALRWVLDHEAVTTVIPGASSTCQVTGNVAAVALPPLSSEIHQKLADLYRDEISQHVRGQH